MTAMNQYLPLQKPGAISTELANLTMANSLFVGMADYHAKLTER